MTAKEYLSQGYRLEQIIKLIKMDIFGNSNESGLGAN